MNYEYQILRYIPDQVSGEFLNVGIIVYGPKENQFYSEFVNSRQRISSVFYGIESTHIVRRLRTLQEKIEMLQKQHAVELQLQTAMDVTFYSKQILKKDDSALQFSEVKKGIDISVEVAFDDLKHRLLYKWVSYKDSDYRSDDDVWRERYKDYFVKAGIADKMVTRSIKTNSDLIEFDQAYKNGVWNYFQPINLNLKKNDSIKNKVYKWKGMLSEISTAEEELKLIFLSEMPEKDNGISDFIREQLNTQTGKNIQSELVTPGQIGELLERYRQNQ